MYQFKDIRVLQLEISSHCNAACPQCPRNYFGGQTIPTLPLTRWSMLEFKKMITIELLEQLDQVYFCGTYGDPMTNKHIVEMCQFLKEVTNKIRIGIHTNGGIGSEETYQELAQCTDFIAFGIDGLEDTNQIYRRNVKWPKVMRNTQAYIKNGGHAIWDYIVFKHNEHQINEANELSKELGFSEFNIKKTSRFINRKHEYKDSLPVYHQQGYIDYNISLPTNPIYINKNYKILNSVNSISKYTQETEISCNACRINEVYIGADGFVFPCGWLHDRLYGPEVESHSDYIKMKAMMADAGGWENANIFYTSLKDIVDGIWFKKIEESWDTSARLERCGLMCGKLINFIKDQNEGLTYKS